MKKIIFILLYFQAAIFLFSGLAVAENPPQTETQMKQKMRPPVVRSPHFVRSGVAYDADEDVTGLITVQDPKSFFNPRTKQVTWWGEFKPFISWGAPQLAAKWYSPSGQLVASQEFKGMACRLAKTTLAMAPYQPEEGRWQVDIYMDGRVIDRRPFVVFDAVRDARDKQNAAAQGRGPEVSSTDIATESQGEKI
ncbi:MAG: hypothetical protein HZC17_01535 [Candidatus Omnitrophica bacterium]|nr:hypothetical protein [Candidatus Omnitrophota bacterium]